MRSGKILTATAFVLLLGLTFVISSCSDDNPLNSGELNNPEFVIVQDQIDNFVDSTFEQIMTGFETMTGISSGGNIDPILYGPGYPDSDHVSISYINGWHVVNLLQSRNAYAFSVLDSVKFYQNNEAAQYGQDADSIYYRHRWSFNMSDTTQTNAALNGQSHYNFLNVHNPEATVDGAHSLEVATKYVSADSTIWRNFMVASEVNNLIIRKTAGGWTQSCPTSGSIISSFEMTYNNGVDAPVTTSWNAEISFVNGSMSVRVTSENTYWDYERDICTTPY